MSPDLIEQCRRRTMPAELQKPSFGFRNFGSYRARALLYAGKPNWRVLGSIVVR